MSVLDIIVRDLKAMDDAEVRRVAKVTGVPWNTLWRLKSGYTPNPQFTTVYRISKYRRSWRIR